MEQKRSLARHGFLLFLFVWSIYFLTMPIDTPPRHVDKFYPIETSAPAPWANQEFIRAQLWIANCNAVEESGTDFHLMVAADEKGVAFLMDCYGNIEWPRGQEIGALAVADALGAWR